MAEAIRTEGDGKEAGYLATEAVHRATESSAAPVDNIDKLGREYLSKRSSSSILYNPTISSAKQSSSYPPEKQPIGKKFFLVPKLVQPKTSAISLKNRNPRLILFEPYKACVMPIIPYTHGENRIKATLPNRRNNLDLNELIQHMNTSKISALNEQKNFGGNALKCDDKYAELKKERDYFESQFKFQAQVNAELKSLLVHSLGEDIVGKVNVLTEDKMKIAEHLSSNTEQIEFLLGQSEVWRSKFLASSLMVEELAKWKASLTQKNSMLMASNKHLLELSSKIRDMQNETLQNLKFLAELQLNMKSANVLDLTAESLNITKWLVLNSGKVGMPEPLELNNLETLTEEEMQATHALQKSHDHQSFEANSDEAFKAVCNQAFQEYKRSNTQSDDDFELIDKH